MRADLNTATTVHCKPIPVMKTRFSLWSFSHREKPVFITGNPVRKTSRENPVFLLQEWVCVEECLTISEWFSPIRSECCGCAAEYTAYNSASFGELKAAAAVAACAARRRQQLQCIVRRATPLHCAGVERWRKCAACQAWLHTTAAQWSTARRAVARYRLPVVPSAAHSSRRTALHCELTVARQSAALAGGSTQHCTVSWDSTDRTDSQ